MEVERRSETPIKVSGTVAQTGPVPFSALFSTKIINAPRNGKAKIVIMDIYDGNTNREEHQGVYKAHMYV